MAKKQWTPTEDFKRWVDEYNQWRLQFHYPKMVPSSALQAMWFQIFQSAKAHEETFPTWDELTAGAKEGPIGTGFSMSSAGWILGPKGRDVDKNILKMARWGRKKERRPETPRYSDRFR